MNQLSPQKALVLLIISVIVVFGGIIFVKAPTTIVLIVAGMAVSALGMLWGIKWKDIENDIVESLKAMFVPILILLCVGMIVGTWILSGTVPVMIYYGLAVLQPSTFLLAVALICSLMSVMTGTSWGTISTVGIALMGVSTGLGVPLQFTAGAIVVGAIFGDKLSPLSDTTVMASAVSDVDIVDHIKHLLWTTIPGYVISLILYTVLGARFASGEVSGEKLQLIMSTLDQTFNLNPILLLPPVVVLILIFMKKPTLPTFAVGIILGGLLAMIFQGATLAGVASAMNGGFTSSTKVDIVDSMLIRGGLKSMLGTVALLIGAGIFGAPLKTTGVIQTLLDWVMKVAQQGRTVMLSTFLSHGFLFMITGSYYATFAVLGPMIKSLYDKFGLHRKNLSRTLEDTGTAFAPVVPWSVTGAFIIGTLGVSYTDYILYAPMTYLGLVFALIYIFTGIGIAKVDK